MAKPVKHSDGLVTFELTPEERKIKDLSKRVANLERELATLKEIVRGMNDVCEE